MAKRTYRTLDERRADAARSDALQIAHAIQVVGRVEAIRARLRATPTVEGIGKAVVSESNPNSKPLSYGLWKRYVDSLQKGYVLATLGEVVQMYCVHCQLPFAVSEGKRTTIGAVIKYDETEVGFDKAICEFYEEDKTVVRPATHTALGCLPCYIAYTKADTETRSKRYRVRYTHAGSKPLTLYAKDLRDASLQLADRMAGDVQIIECKPIPERRGFLDVRAKVLELLNGGAK